MGGAKNCPETPRQRMIGMMYLVLTAMLALNVSTDVLKAFKLVDDSLHSTLSTTETSNNQMMAQFRAMRDDNPQKNGEWYDKAAELTQRSDSLFNYIQDFKYHIAVQTDGAKKADPEARVIQGNDNRDATTQYALSEKNGFPATVLKNMLVEYREYLTALDPARAEEFNITFDVSDKQEQGDKMISWEDQMFHDMPSGAAVTLMTKLQNDVRNAQNEMIHYLMGRTDAGDMRVNKMSAYVIPSSRTVIRGSKYSAKIIMAAIDSTQTPEYYVEGNRINDQGVYEVTASGEGLKKFSGWISFPDPATGEMTKLPFTSDYTVTPPNMTISNKDLTIMYRDYPNKFSISVPGISDESKIKVSVSGAPARKEGGYWIIKPGEGAKQVTISVMAEFDGKMQKMGDEVYKVLDLPKPRAFFKLDKNTYDGSKPVARSVMTNPQAYIDAGYGPDVALQLSFEVVSFRARISGMVTDSKGNQFSADQLKRIKNLDGGTVINLVDIKVRPKGGTSVSTLPPFPLELK